MIGSLIGAGLSIASSIFGGIKASQAAKKAQANVENRKAAEQALFDRRYNEDATQRADAQRMLTRMQEEYRNRNRNAAGTMAVTGGTEASAAAEKEANAKAAADAASQIVANADGRKDRIEAQHLAQQDAYDQQLQQMQINKGAAIAQAAQGVGNAGAAIASMFDDDDDKVKYLDAQ